MEYRTIKETALRWGISERTVNALCTAGRVEGAVKFGNAWAIPETAEKPCDSRKNRAKAEKAAPAKLIQHTAMPLLSTPFSLGHCREVIEQIEDLDARNIALAEYYYFSGQSEKVSDLIEPYLEHEDIALRVSACWLYSYANLMLDKPKKAKQAAEIIHTLANALNEDSPLRDKAYIICASTGISVLLHLPMPQVLTAFKTYGHMMPPGMRLFILYIEAHHACLNKYYGVAIGIAETALALECELYPIPSMYLHLIACVAYINLKHPERAKEHFMAAWRIAQPDDLLQPIAEHHGLVGGTLEATLKRLFPNDFKRIISLTYKFSSGWRKLHDLDHGIHLSDTLTTTEFAAAMLAARNWTNQEIALHMGISEYTVRHYISNVFQKLNIVQRKDLKNILLR